MFTLAKYYQAIGYESDNSANTAICIIVFISNYFQALYE